MFRKLCVLFAGMFILSGCAGFSKSTIEYYPPKAKKIVNEIIIDKPFDSVWDKLISNLSKKYFVINNVEKVSRIINVSFSSDEPENYIDCGRTSRTFMLGSEGSPERFHYESAADSVYKTTIPNPVNNKFNIPILVRYKTALDGRTNIYVAPKGNRTAISVNTRYIFKQNVVTQALVGGAVSQTNLTLSFNTNQEGTRELYNYGEIINYKCVSKGIIEGDILRAAGG